MNASRPVHPMAPAERTIPRSDAALLVLGIVAAGVAVDGLLMVLVGSGSLFAQPATGAGVALVLLGLGSALSVGAFGLLRRGRGSALRLATPRLYPFAPLWMNAGLFVILLVGAVSVFHGFFDVFTSAHNGGNVSQLSDQGDLSALLIGASVVVWVLTLYAVAVMFRVFQLGRFADVPRAGRDVYGRPVDPPSSPPTVRPDRAPSPPVPERARSVLVAVTILLALVISAAMQILEVDVGPAAPAAWLWAQLFTPMLTVPVATGIALVDRGIRDLEQRFVRVALDRPAHSAAPTADL